MRFEMPHAWAASSEPSQASSEIEQLKKEIAALCQRVESLEKRLKEGLIPPTTRDGNARPGIIAPYPGVRQVPPDWKRFEFNGTPYYVIPIDETHKLASEATKQVPRDQSPVAPKAVDNIADP